MDPQKPPLPPRIPGARMANNPDGNRFTNFAVVGSLLLAVFVLFNFALDFSRILPFLRDLGGEFLIKYIFSINVLFLLILTAGVGALTLGQRNRWGWPLAYGAALFNIFFTIFTVIMTLDSPFAWSVYSTIFQTVLFYVSFFLAVGVVVILSLQPVRFIFKVDSNQRIIGFGIMGFLVLDVIVCYFLL